MQSYKASDKNTKQGLANNQTGNMTQNGWIVTSTKNTTNTTYKDYCPKCGKLKSQHGFFGGCPK